MGGSSSKPLPTFQQRVAPWLIATINSSYAYGSGNGGTKNNNRSSVLPMVLIDVIISYMKVSTLLLCGGRGATSRDPLSSIYMLLPYDDQWRVFKPDLPPRRLIPSQMVRQIFTPPLFVNIINRSATNTDHQSLVYLGGVDDAYQRLDLSPYIHHEEKKRSSSRPTSSHNRNDDGDGKKYQWIPLAPSLPPPPHDRYQSITIDGVLHLFGSTVSTDTIMAWHLRHDPSTQSYISCAVPRLTAHSMDIALIGIDTYTTNTTIVSAMILFVGIGIRSQQYSPATDTWTDTPVPIVIHRRSYEVAVVPNHYRGAPTIFFVGGTALLPSSASEQPGHEMIGDIWSSTMLSYSLAIDDYITCPPQWQLPHANFSCAITYVEGMGIVICGGDDGSIVAGSTACYVLDVHNRDASWNLLPNLPRPLSRLKPVVWHL